MDELLNDLKLTLDVTWDDDDTDRKLTRILERSCHIVSEYAGEEIDFEADKTARQLLLDCCRYIWNNVAEEFKTNFGAELVQLRSRYQCKRKSEEEAEKPDDETTDETPEVDAGETEEDSETGEGNTEDIPEGEENNNELQS